MRKLVVACLSLAALWTILLFVGAATVPVYFGSSTATGAGETTETSTLLQQEGAWVFLLLAVPAAAVLGTALLLILEPRHRWARWAAWVPVALVGILAALGMLTIGIFLLPVVGLLGLAVLMAANGPAGPARPA